MVILARYPFIYDPASKARLLGASNSSAQWEEFQNAFLESLTQGGAMPFMLLRVRGSPLLTHLCIAWLQHSEHHRRASQT